MFIKRGDAHECDSDTKKNIPNEKQMDFHNNYWGYTYASTHSVINETQFYNSFMSTHNNGQIKILKNCN